MWHCTLRARRRCTLRATHSPLSFPHPAQLLERPAEPRPCIVYLHGNASARLEAVPNIALALSIGASLLGIDCAGSGHSDGEFVSLGFFERDDLRSAVAYLRESGRVSSVAFWGHSMGAVAALMHANRDPSVAGMVLDSPFCDLVQLAEELVQKTRDQGVTVPGFAVSVALHFVRSSVQKRAGFDIHAIKPIAHAPESFVPAMFVVGTDDDFVPPHHAKALHAAYAGDANMVEVSGDHNTPRPRFLYVRERCCCGCLLPLLVDRVTATLATTAPPRHHCYTTALRHTTHTTQ